MKRKLSESLAGDLLIIGYGNELRSDDGVGPKVADVVAEWRLPGVRALGCHQLMPELAVPLAAAGRVVFVDAAKDFCSVHVREIEPLRSTQVMTHAVDPGALLQLTKILYQHSPLGLSLTIPAEDFSFGSNLSDVCRKGMQIALDHIRMLAKNRPIQTGWLSDGQEKTSVCQPGRGRAPRRKSLCRKEIKTYA